VSPSSHLRTEEDPFSEMVGFAYRITDDVLSPEKQEI
jgi:hypothetical protein